MGRASIGSRVSDQLADRQRTHRQRRQHRSPSTASSRARAGSRSRETCRPWSRTSAPACAAETGRRPGCAPERTPQQIQCEVRQAAPNFLPRQRERTPRKAPPHRTPSRRPKSSPGRYEYRRTVRAPEHGHVAQLSTAAIRSSGSPRRALGSATNQHPANALPPAPDAHPGSPIHPNDAMRAHPPDADPDVCQREQNGRRTRYEIRAGRPIDPRIMKENHA